MILLSNLQRKDGTRCMFDSPCSRHAQPGGPIGAQSTTEISDLSCRCVFAAGGQIFMIICMIMQV